MSQAKDVVVRGIAVMLGISTFFLALMAYTYHRKAEEKSRQAQAAVESEQRVMRAFETSDAHSRLLYHMVGYKPLTEMDVLATTKAYPLEGPMAEVEKNFQADLTQYGANAKPNQKNYRGLLQHVNDMMRVRNADLTQARQREQDLIEEREALRTEMQDRIARLEKTAQAAIADLSSQRSQFNQDRDRLQTQNSELANQVADRQQMIADLTARHENQKSALERQVTVLQLRLDMALKKIARTRGIDVPEQAAGQLTWVGGRTKTAQVDLGTADGLKRQVTFLVFDKSVSNLRDAQPKGKVEVTVVKEAHRAEVRILDEQLDDPLMPGDKVYSLSWRKGVQARFATAGILDLDGDGTGDGEKVKGLITASGGLIDAEQLADGSISGTMSLETDFLVLGEPPSGLGNSTGLENYTRLVDQADELGIPTLPLDRFLAMLGQ